MVFNLILCLAIYYRCSRHSSIHELAATIKERRGGAADVKQEKGENIKKWRRLYKMRVCDWCILVNARSLNVRTVLRASPAASVE